MPERRKHERKDLLYYSRVKDSRSGVMLGYLVNITPEGLMVLCEKPVEPGLQTKLLIEMPEDLSDFPHLEIEAISVWCLPDVNPQFYDVGYQFLNARESYFPVIQKLVKDYGLR